jgi:hypothetical protein
VNGREPGHVSEEALAASDFVATMGCATLELDGVDTDDWHLDDPGERPIEEVRAIRDEVERRVVAVFDERFGEDGGERYATGRFWKASPIEKSPVAGLTPAIRPSLETARASGDATRP